jgi:hypothetical protein
MVLANSFVARAFSRTICACVPASHLAMSSVLMMKRMDSWPSDLHMRSVRSADGGERMHVEVETHEAQGMPMPWRIRLDERAIEVAEVLDQWFGADYRYCKIRGDDGALYILRLDEKRFAWSLTLFTSPKAQALVPQTGPASARRE